MKLLVVESPAKANTIKSYLDSNFEVVASIGHFRDLPRSGIGIDEEKVTEEASFIDDLGADSLDTVELVMAFEEEFGSEISDSEAEKILTVGDAIKFIESKSS